MFTDNPNVSRRAVTKTAAWGVPAVAVVSAAPAFAASHHEQTITRNLTFHVWVGLNKVTTRANYPIEPAPPYTTPSGLIDQEVWDTVVTTTLPTSITPNTALPAPPLTVTVTTSLVAAETLATFGVTWVEGTSEPDYIIEGSVVNPGLRSANLVVPRTFTPQPAAPITTVAAGAALPETSTTAGAVSQRVGNGFVANLGTDSLVITAMGLVGALEPAGQNTDFGSITVG